ncbi:MAG: ABC transporter ATP-binding protein, partial [Thiomicrorhabdus sp.]|nr:ABC transporter ATP-binding protein [Thiomicrorhabdus sp.]
MPKLNIDAITATHQNTPIFDQLSLTLQDGEIGCLLGPSGCGKTTLLRCIAGLKTIDSGLIQLGERTLSQSGYSLPTEQRNIGVVFQDYALFPHMTIEQNIRFGIKHLTNKEQKSRLKSLLDLVGLGHVEQRYPHELSGGQQQRIALARALAPKPAALLLDEPFSGLDVELRESLAREVRTILKAEGITALMVTHNQNEA